MRIIVTLIILAAIGFCGWWGFASMTLRSNIDDWFEARRAEGWVAEVAPIASGGFPSRISVELGNIEVADPDTGLFVATQSLGISALATWPGDLSITLDDQPIEIATPLGNTLLQMQDGRVALDTHPGAELELDELRAQAGPWTISQQNGALLASASSLTAQAIQVEGAHYTITGTADQFAPGELPLQWLGVTEELPDVFEVLSIDAEARFDREWDRRALSEQRPQPTHIKLKRAQAHWGDMQINLAGDLAIDKNGIPNGPFHIQAENWQTMLDIAEQSGRIPSDLRGQLEGLVGAMARANGNSESLDVTLTLRDGYAFLGFIPIGRAPVLRLR